MVVVVGPARSCLLLFLASLSAHRRRDERISVFLRHFSLVVVENWGGTKKNSVKTRSTLFSYGLLGKCDGKTTSLRPQRGFRFSFVLFF